MSFLGILIYRTKAIAIISFLNWISTLRIARVVDTIPTAVGMSVSLPLAHERVTTEIEMV